MCVCHVLNGVCCGLFAVWRCLRCCLLLLYVLYVFGLLLVAVCVAVCCLLCDVRWFISVVLICMCFVLCACWCLLFVVYSLLFAVSGLLFVLRLLCAVAVWCVQVGV